MVTNTEGSPKIGFQGPESKGLHFPEERAGRMMGGRVAAALPSCPLVRPSGRCPGGPCSIRVCTLQLSRMDHKKLVIFSCLCPIKSVIQMVP